MSLALVTLAGNGRAERAVASAKLMLKKCLERRQCWKMSLMYWNLCPCPSGASPSEILHRCRIHSHIPDLRPDIQQDDLDHAITRREEDELQRHAQTRNRSDLSLLDEGSHVLVWNERSKRYDKKVRVVKRKSNDRSYILQDEDTSRLYARNRIHLRKYISPPISANPITVCPVVSASPKLKSILKTKYRRKLPMTRDLTVTFDKSWSDAKAQWAGSQGRWVNWTLPPDSALTQP